ncbi:MAG: hypothetical protein D3922_04670 [Candidatus Electrothrix sp. AR1]|nr:hypothetical protein [Candidatus Electrothrix sp. AR1]
MKKIIRFYDDKMIFLFSCVMAFKQSVKFLYKEIYHETPYSFHSAVLLPAGSFQSGLCLAVNPF